MFAGHSLWPYGIIPTDPTNIDHHAFYHSPLHRSQIVTSFEGTNDSHTIILDLLNNDNIGLAYGRQVRIEERFTEQTHHHLYLCGAPN